MLAYARGEGAVPADEVRFVHVWFPKVQVSAAAFQALFGSFKPPKRTSDRSVAM
jgi:hypothetical protein